MALSSDDESIAHIRESAALWLARRHSGEWTAEYAADLNAWLAADRRHRQEYEDLSALWTAVGDLADGPAAGAEALPRAPHRRRPALAAALLATMALALAWLWPVDFAASGRSVVTAAGERRQIALDDGSRIHLDADSAVTIRKPGDGMRITLERGAAFFEVAHDPGRRFEVVAGTGRVVDIGTRFGVHHAGNRVTVGVAEGEVEVSAGETAARRLIAGQGVVIANNAVEQPFPLDADVAFAWREGRLVFARTPLAEVVVAANRYRREPMVVADPALAALEVSGVFRVDDPAALVWALEQALPLRAEARDGRIELTGRGTGMQQTAPRLLR